MAQHTEAIDVRRNRTSFQSFLLSLFLSKLADQILLFLVPLVVFQTTNDIAWSGLAFAVEAFPRFLSFPICGVLCDRVAPVKLMRVSQLLRAAACIGGVVASMVVGGVGWLIALSAVCGVLTTQGAMAREVLLPQAFKTNRFERVLAYSQTADQTGAVLGPVLAAYLLGLWRWELVVCITAIGFLLADAAMAVWRNSTQAVLLKPEATKGQWTKSFKTALAHVAFLPGLKRLVILAAGVNLIIGVTLASSAAMVTGLLGQSAGYYAGLQTAGAVVTVVILLAIAHVSVPLKWIGLLAFMLILLGGVLTAVSSNHWTYAVGFLLVVGFDKMFNIYIRSSRQKIIPAADYGKTIGVVVLLNNLTQPLAGLAIGLFSRYAITGEVILALTLAMGLLGLAATMALPPKNVLHS